MTIRGTVDLVASTCMAVASLALLWMILTARFGSSMPAPAAGGLPSGENVEGQALRLSAPTTSISSPSPKTAVVEFSDFECPFCGRYATETFPRLKSEYVDEGKVAYVFMHFPLDELHPNANMAARSAVCAQRHGQFWTMHEELFRHQRALSVDAIARLASMLHLGKDGLNACLDAAANQVRHDQAEGRRLGVNSTPTVFVGTFKEDGTITIRRKIAGAYPYDTFKKAIDEVAGAEARKTMVAF